MQFCKETHTEKKNMDWFLYKHYKWGFTNEISSLFPRFFSLAKSVILHFYQWSCSRWTRSYIKSLQIPKSKIKLFCTFSKIDPKIRKMSKFQNNTTTALVDGFWWNLVQMKGLGLYFPEKLSFLIFGQFYYVF